MISPKTILFIRWARLGDVVLTEPAVRLCRQLFSSSRIIYLTSHFCAAVPAMMPAVDEVIPLDRVALRDGNKISSLRRLVSFAYSIRRLRADSIVELTGFHESQLLARWSGAAQRVGFERAGSRAWKFCLSHAPVVENKSIPVTEMFRQVVLHLKNGPKGPAGGGTGGDSNEASAARFLRDEIIPSLTVPHAAQESARRVWQEQRLDTADIVYGLQVSAPVISRMWPLERFLALAIRLIREAAGNGRRPGFVCFAAPAEASWCERLSAVIRENNCPVATSINEPIPQLAAMMKRCTVIISNDTGPMHLSAAVGTATLGLFSVDFHGHYHPLGRRCDFIERTPISDITAEEVLAKLSPLRTLEPV